MTAQEFSLKLLWRLRQLEYRVRKLEGLEVDPNWLEDPPPGYLLEQDLREHANESQTSPTG